MCDGARSFYTARLSACGRWAARAQKPPTESSARFFSRAFCCARVRSHQYIINRCFIFGALLLQGQSAWQALLHRPELAWQLETLGKQIIAENKCLEFYFELIYN